MLRQGGAALCIGDHLERCCFEMFVHVPSPRGGTYRERLPKTTLSELTHSHAFFELSHVTVSIVLITVECSSHEK
jgi:hypothetical protein